MRAGTGAKLGGVLEMAGIGVPVDVPDEFELSTLQGSCAEHNKKLLSALHEDEHAKALFSLTEEDAKLGRMTSPVPGPPQLPLCIVSDHGSTLFRVS